MNNREHPELEDLAALADGRLEGDVRQRLVEHLAGCEECRFLLDETLHVMDDRSPEEASEETPQEIPAATSPNLSVQQVLIALAALLFLVMGLRYLAPPPAASLEGLSEAVAGSEQAGPETPLPSAWGTVRSGDPAELSTTARDCRIGSLAVRFHLANVIGNRNAAVQQAARLEGLLSSGGYPVDPRRRYGRQAERLRNSQPTDPEASFRALELLDDYLLERPSYALGKWAEMARQAARFGFADHFDGLAVPKEVLAHPWSADLHATLEALDADLRGDPDLPQLEERLTALLDRVGR